MKIIISKDIIQGWLDDVNMDDDVTEHELYDPSFVTERALQLWCADVNVKDAINEEYVEQYIEGALNELGISAGRSEFDEQLYYAISGAIDEMYRSLNEALTSIIPLLKGFDWIDFCRWVGDDIVLEAKSCR